MNGFKIFTAAALVAASATAEAQDITHIKELLAQAQNEIAALESAEASRAAEAAHRQPVAVESCRAFDGVIPIDTLPTINDAVKVVIYNDNTWCYRRTVESVADSTVYTKYWDTTTLFPYREVALSSLPQSVSIELVDSLKAYHCPRQGKVISKYGIRRRRRHQGCDVPLKTGDPVYAAFDGRVRISQYNNGGYGNLVIIRHDNGLETYYGHLSERLVADGEWVEAGKVIGLGGSTGRSTGPHLHFETRYYGQAFDPERLIDFEKGTLRRDIFLLKRSFFDANSRAGQDFEDEIANDREDKAEAAERAAITYYTVRSGDSLSRIAVKYGTTVTRLCQLNGIDRNATLRIGRKLRVR